MIVFAAQWSHAAAAVLFGALGVWLIQRSRRDGQGLALVAACGITAVWALVVAMEGPTTQGARLAESARNLGWLGVMFMMVRSGGEDRRTPSVMLLYGVLALVILGQAIIDLLPGEIHGIPRLAEAVFLVSLVLRMIVAVGALVLVHNLYIAAAPDARERIRLPMVALAAMWTYDLNLYTVSYLARGWSAELLAMRGGVFVLLAPVFALAARRTSNWTLRLSRTVAFQSLSLFAIGAYLVTMVIITSALEIVGGDYARIFQVGFVFATSVAAIALLPSERFRDWFRVKIAKHLFQHRYDYRAEWIRFTDTLGRPGDEADGLETRIVQAIADITESPGGLLLVPDEAGGGLVLQARWNWGALDVPAHAAGASTERYFGETARIVELDAVRGDADSEEAPMIPEWIMVEDSAWALVPLVHFDRLLGVVLLARPRIDRTLDWEDFDLLRVVGRQVASYLSEAQGQQALADVKRFDEFNRRFAFIMHDIKNLVSQLTLVTRNAERHADNPEFRADMIATLRNSTQRMNELLARLSQHNKSRAEEPRAIPAGAAVDAVASAKRALHPVVLGGQTGLFVVADPARLEQAVGHLIQNAIDASPANEPVCIDIERRGLEVAIEILDRGCGMPAEFVRHKLFKPFSSLKEGGFGIGAYEARSLIAAMGGRIEVESREAEGSRFTIFLPLATQPGAPATQDRTLAA